MTFAVVRDIPQGGLLWKHTSAGYQALGVNPLLARINGHRNYLRTNELVVFLLTSRLSSREQETLGDNLGFGTVRPSTHEHTARNPNGRANTLAAASELFAHHIHPFPWDASCPTSAAAFPPWEPDRKPRYGFHTCCSVTAPLNMCVFRAEVPNLLFDFPSSVASDIFQKGSFESILNGMLSKTLDYITVIFAPIYISYIQ